MEELEAAVHAKRERLVKLRAAAEKRREDINAVGEGYTATNKRDQPAVERRLSDSGGTLASDERGAKAAPVKAPSSLCIHVQDPVSISTSSTEAYDKGIQTAIMADKVVDSVVEVVDEMSASKDTSNDMMKSSEQGDEANRITPVAVDDCINSEDFHSFLESSSRVMERALVERSVYDFAASYTDRMGHFGGSNPSEGLLSVLSSVTESNHGRAISSLQWSPDSEFFLSACADTDAHADGDGLVNVWSVHRTSSEASFVADSPVMCACYAPFNPVCLMGGLVSGQVVVWDTRIGARAVGTSNVDAVTHTECVLDIMGVGTRHAHTVASMSVDGRVCFWNPASLRDGPIEAINVTQTMAEDKGVSDVSKSLRRVSCQCMCFRDEEAASFTVGGEDGSLYLVSRLENRSDKQATATVLREAELGSNSFITHAAGPISRVSYHRSGRLGSSHLAGHVLTASLDWTCGIWNAATGSRAGTLELSDYVYDARWCPSRDGILATGDGSGLLSIWSLGDSMDAPVASVRGGSAVTRLAWSVDGQMIVAGDLDGCLRVCTVSHELCRQGGDDDEKLKHRFGAG